MVGWDKNHIWGNSYFCAWAEDWFTFNVYDVTQYFWEQFFSLTPTSLPPCFLFYFIPNENIHIVQKAKNKYMKKAAE